MHRSSHYLPLLALLGSVVACIGCRTGEAERHVTVAPGPVTFSSQGDVTQSRLVRDNGGQPAEATAEKPPAENAVAQSEPAAAEAPAAEAPAATTPAPGATASLSDTPTPDAEGKALSAEDRAALAERLRDADPEVRELAGRLASLDMPAGAVKDAASADASAADAAPDDERLPTLGDGNVAQATAAETEAGAVQQTVGGAENAEASEVKPVAATSTAEPQAAEGDAVATADADAAEKDPLASLTDEQIFAHLIGRYEKRTAVTEPDAEVASHDLIALRTLKMLSGDPDGAVAPIEGWQPAEQEFLSYQLLALWRLVDPAAHPVRIRRWSSALPELRQATHYLAASTDSLEVGSLAWCTEVVWYGQITPFPSDRFVAGQEVILYSEIDNFGAERLSDGVETHLQGTYEIIDISTGANVAMLAGEVDRQKHNKAPRDYFLPYRFHLPHDLKPGKYKLQMTVEDFKSGKFGRSSIPFEIAPAR